MQTFALLNNVMILKVHVFVKHLPTFLMKFLQICKVLYAEGVYSYERHKIVISLETWYTLGSLKGGKRNENN